MLEWIRPYLPKSRVSAVNPHQDRPSPSLVAPRENDTWVYVWRITSNTPGHASIQVGDDYVSIHPEGLPSMGPTAILPLPASLSTTLANDNQIESDAQNKSKISNEFDFLPPRVSTPKTEPSSPDFCFKIPGLNTKEMKTHIAAIKDKVATGQQRYQLLPNVNMVGFFHHAAAFVNQDPIDIALHLKDSQNDVLPSVDNCTTLVAKILAKGGFFINHSRMPWGITPNGLADKITEDSRACRI